MRTAYLDCFSGVSGDMLLGALVDAGLPESLLREVVAALRLDGVALEISRPVVQGFAATRVQVHGPRHHHEHHHAHRHLAEIATLLDRTDLDTVVRERSLAVFTRLAEAEAAVHATTPERIHFHEVGADDALVDIVGTVAGLAWLGVERLVCSPLPLTSGWILRPRRRSPARAGGLPALLAGVPVYGEDLRQELVTPTGAALVRELAAGFGPLPPLRIEATGYGAGIEGTKRWPPQPAAAAARSVAGGGRGPAGRGAGNPPGRLEPGILALPERPADGLGRPGCLPGAHAHEKGGRAACCGC